MKKHLLDDGLIEFVKKLRPNTTLVADDNLRKTKHKYNVQNIINNIRIYFIHLEF